MAPTPYKIHHIHKRAPNGITQTASCSLNAYLKFDCDESPHCVYNEYVATKLAQTLHVPMAFGVLTTTADGQAFASLEVDAPGIPLPNIHHKQHHLAAQRYPNEVAALVAFEILG